MSKKLTTEEFIQNAKQIHNDKYNYSKVNYNGNKTKVCIICPEHGEFYQSPNNHLKPHGCSKCFKHNKKQKQLEIKTKTCIKCNIEKDINLFRKYRNICQECNLLYHQTYNQDHKEHLSQYFQNYYKTNQEHLNQQKHKYYTQHQEKFKKFNKEYRLNNKEKILKIQKNYYWNKYKTDPLYKISKTLKRRILLAVKQQKTSKAFKSIELLGCSIPELLNHLQQTAIKNGYINFDINNYSSIEYHIDHILPCAHFNLKSPEEQKKCFNWTNLQILSAQENIIKNDNIN